MAAVRATLNAAGLALEHDEPEFGALVTKAARYEAATWLPAPALALPAGHTPHTVQFHVHVEPALEPARIAIGVVLDTTSIRVPLRLPKGRGHSRFYGQRPLGVRLLDAVSDRLGVRPEPLALTSEGRAAQAQRLLPAGLTGGCGVVPAALLAPPDAPQPTKTRYFVLPIYPEALQRRGAGGFVTVAGRLTEHGTLTAIGTEDDRSGEENLVAAALGAAGLWRFRASRNGPCPAQQRIHIEMRFVMERG